MKKKVIMAVFLVGILLIVGFSVYGLNKFFNSPEMLTKKYSEELGDVISLGENQKVIRVIKDYVDNDDVEDYVVLYGTEKYSDVSAVEGAAPNLEMYSGVGIQYINGENTEVIKYDTGKTFDVNVELSVEVDSDTNYIFVTDANSGNACLLKLNDDKTFTDLIKDSLGEEPKGYMVSSTWDTTNTSKLKVKLDKGDISYLPEKTDEYILDYTNTKVNQNSYRQKYVMNKFNYFIAEDMKIDKDSKKSSDKAIENKVTNETVENTGATSNTNAENTENKKDTTAKVEVSKNMISIKGHANFGDYGSDIVCASVSSTVLTTINAIMSICTDTISVVQSSGNMQISVQKENDITRKLLDNMIRCLKEIEINYGKNIKIREE